MDELLQRAPTAHEHLEQVPDPEIAEQLAGRILQLAHGDLVTEVDDGIEPVLEHKQPDQYTSHESSLHDRVTGHMLEVGRLTRSATEVAARRQKEIYPDRDWPVQEDEVLKQAQTMADQEAQTAFEQGDKAAAVRALETSLVIGLLNNRSGGNPGVVRRAISSGMATEILEAIDNTRGLISIPDNYESPADIPSQLQESKDLLQLATNSTLNDRLEVEGPLVRPGMPPEDVAKRQEGLQKLSHIDTAALASDTLIRKKNGGEATRLALLAVGKLTEDDHLSALGREAGSELAVVIVIASRCVETAQDPKSSEQLNSMLGILRSRRDPGNYYRTNSQSAHILDNLVVELVNQGHTEAAKALLSSTAREITHGPRDPQTGDNLNHSIHYSTDMDADEKDRVRESLIELHKQKIDEFRQTLSAAGAREETIDAILSASYDPDSALSVDPEFWPVYDGMTFDDAEDRRINRDITETIEGSGTSRLADRAKVVMAIAEAGIDPSNIGPHVVRALENIQSVEEKNIFITQMKDLIPLVDEDLKAFGETAYSFSVKDKDRILQDLMTFKNPLTAYQVAKDFYGEDYFDRLTTDISYYFDRNSYDPPNTMEEVDIAKFEALTVLARFGDHNSDHVQLIREIMRDGSYTPERLAEVFAWSDNPVIQEINSMAGSFEVEKRALRDHDSGESLDRLVKLYAESGLQATVAAIDDSHIKNQLLSAWVYNSHSRAEYAHNAVLTFSTTEFTDLYGDLPRSVRGDLLASLGQFHFAPERAQQLVGAFKSGELDDLAAYVRGLPSEGGNREEEINSLLGEIIGHRDPREAAEAILSVYQAADFLQEAHIHPAYHLHLRDWQNFFKNMPADPRERAHRQQQLLGRIRNNPNENEAQGLRIFDELVVSEQRSRQAELTGRVLIEQLFLAESTRGFPSAKEQKLKETFFDSRLGQAYRSLYLAKEQGDEPAAQAVLTELGIAPTDHKANLTILTATLKEQVAELHEEDRAAQRWVKDFVQQSIPTERLLASWKSRHFAMGYGAKDNPRDIRMFVAEKGVELHGDEQIITHKSPVTKEEFEDHRYMFAELGYRYGIEQSFEAIERHILFKRVNNGQMPEKLLKPKRVYVEESAKGFRVDALAPDDVRGFTIGVDTGCCMTLGGASSSCIWAGYEDERYSFLAVYDDNNKLRAQSLLYLNNVDGRTVLVVDNIEANEGTDLATIANVYRSSLVQMIDEQGLDVDAIHIGVGYTPDEAIRGLPNANDNVPTPQQGVYTDAHAQKVLWEKPKTPEPVTTA